jgi:opacity protein-like surface antigen
MKRLIFVAICLFLFLSSSYALGADGTYVSGNIAIGFASDSDISETGFPTVEASFDTGFAIAGAIGTSFNTFRFEGEISYQKNDFDEAKLMGEAVQLQGDMSALNFLVNGYYDFNTNSPWTPYLTAGLGLSKIDVNDLDVVGGNDPTDDDDIVFAYQLGAGIGYGISENLTIQAGYRYFATADPDFSGTEAEVASHDIYLGMRFYF